MLLMVFVFMLLAIVLFTFSVIFTQEVVSIPNAKPNVLE